MKKTVCTCILIASQLTQGFFWRGNIRFDKANGTYTYKNAMELRVQGSSYVLSHLSNPPSTLDDAGEFASELFEEHVKPDFEADNISEKTLALWCFCMEATLEQATRYIAEAGGSPDFGADWRKQTDLSPMLKLQLDNANREVLRDWQALFATEVVQNLDEIRNALTAEKRVFLEKDIEDIVNHSVTFRYKWSSDLEGWPEVPYFANNPWWGVPLASAAGGMIVYGGAVAVKTSVMLGSGLGTILCPGIGTILGCAGGAIVSGGLALWVYYKYGEENYEVTIGAAEEGLAKWGDTQVQRKKCLKDVLERYHEVREQLKIIHAPIESLERLTAKAYDARPAFANAWSKKDWKEWCSNMKDRLSMLQSSYEETVAHLEDTYINFPLLVAYSEAIAGCEFLLTAKSMEHFAECNRDVLGKIERSLMLGIESLKECHNMAFRYSTSPLCLSTVDQYNNTYCYSMIDSGRPDDLSDEEKRSHWIDDISKGRIQLTDNEMERAERGTLRVVVEPRTYFDLMELYRLLGTQENKNWQALFLDCPPEGISNTVWWSHIGVWKRAMERWRKEAFGGNAKPVDDPGGIYEHWQRYKQCPPVFTLKALQRKFPDGIEDKALLAQLIDALEECKSPDQLPACLKTWKLSKNTLQRLQALPYGVNGEGHIIMDAPLDIEDELLDYVQLVLLDIKQEYGAAQEKGPWWKFF